MDAPSSGAFVWAAYFDAHDRPIALESLRQYAAQMGLSRDDVVCRDNEKLRVLYLERR